MLHNNYLLGYCKEAEIFIKAQDKLKTFKGVFNYDFVNEK